MSCFSKFFKIHKSFDLPVLNSVPGVVSKVISHIYTRNIFSSGLFIVPLSSSFSLSSSALHSLLFVYQSVSASLSLPVLYLK